jgi:hypothetical protein
MERVQIIRMSTAGWICVFVSALSFVAGLLAAPSILQITRTSEIEKARAKGFMNGLACNTKNRREWPIDGKDPCGAKQ